MYKIVIVEDEHLIRKGLKFGIDYSSLDCVVIGEAEDGQQAIEVLNELNPDIVIIDINLPIKTGLQVLGETSHLHYSAIILSGYSEFEYAQKAIKLDVVEYLTKPLQPKKLIEAINKAKNKHDSVKLLDRIGEQTNAIKQPNLMTSVRQTTDELVKEMIEYIKENYHEKFTMNDVVKHFGYSETHLSNKFKKHTELTFNDYLNRYRITIAIDLMKQGLVDFNVLSDRCGFSNTQYFDKVFTKYVTISLKEYLSLLQ